MTAETLLARLDQVRQTGADRWLACCPAHEDRHPSLNIRELPDGRVLVHCFTGCDIGAILAAVGLEFSDLFPPRSVTETFLPAERRRFHAADVLVALEQEILVVTCAAGEIQRRGYLTDSELDRMGLASDRITGAMAYAARYVG